MPTSDCKSASVTVLAKLKTPVSAAQKRVHSNASCRQVAVGALFSGNK
eukprot:CAMPEP_0171097148 /NCGR_PEP_ID=MMETSP0766_2-20121228/47083_1 /TAXON_ID=439317 /ORGANISM="Gambierdiscus australes, Strain CAWD 149" /LENGTH=47 /DNA_ID= /DNA_START= /DNA_END= /DNA_ORIENTATION=